MGGIRWTEEDLKDYQARQKRQVTPCVQPKLQVLPHPQPVSSGESVADVEKKQKRRKYGNERVQVDGIVFDSRKEARYYEELKMRRVAGDLKLVLLQVPFILPGNIRYKADFLTIDKDGNYEVIDVKSDATRKNRVYINKKKQMAAVWGIEIKEV